jgi:rubrerythrin
MNTLTGLITSISDITESNGYKRLSFVIENEKESACFQKSCKEDEQHLDNFLKYNKVGDEVTVEFYLKANEWKGKYYTNLNAGKVEKVK